MHALRPKPFTGRMMLLSILAFFGVVIAANLIMMTFALRTHTGAVVPNSYVASQDYNRRIADARSQEELGWSTTQAYDGTGIDLAYRDRAGAPLRGLALAGVVGRFVTDRDDRPLAFREGRPGHYRAPATLAPGAWRLETAASAADGRIYRMESEIFIPVPKP